MIFPANWIRDTPPNKRINYCFYVEEEQKLNRILITVNYFDPSKRPTIMQAAQQALKLQIQEEKDNMVEKDIRLQELPGDNGVGYYFMATDRNWSPSNTDEWPYMLRCFYVATNQMIEITVLHHRQPTYIINQVFDMLRGL